MLLLNDMKPEMSVFYYSAILLNEITSEQGQDIISLYEKVKQKQYISLKIFSYCLDWLYLIEAARVNLEGAVYLCSYKD